MKHSFVSKTDLAVAYFPYVNQHSARHKLMELINDDHELITQLRSTGYTKLSHMFSPRQVEMIIQKYGNPFS